MNFEKINRSVDKEIEEGIVDYYESEKEKTFESGEKITEISLTREQIKEIGEAFGGVYIKAFTEAVSEGKNFQEADKLAREECLGKKVDISFYGGGYVSGNFMLYTSNSWNKYLLTQDDEKNFRLTFPDNSIVAGKLKSLEQDNK